jgi:mRNA interferase RelE/StbE
LRVDYDERAISQATAFFDDPPGIRAVLDAIDQLAGDPRPDGSFPYGSPDLRRLRIGRYRVLYEISEDAIAIRHIARAILQLAAVGGTDEPGLGGRGRTARMNGSRLAAQHGRLCEGRPHHVQVELHRGVDAPPGQYGRDRTAQGGVKQRGYETPVHGPNRPCVSRP